jgi:hypothetical protein
VLFESMRYTLLAVDASGVETLLQSTGAIAGPEQSASGRLWVAMGGQLMRDDGGGGFEEVVETRDVTCLKRWSTLTYACATTELYRLGDDGLEERVFELDGLGAPEPELIPAGGERDCGLQWLLYRTDLESIGLSVRDAADAGASTPDAGTAVDMLGPPERDPATKARPSSGCSASATRSLGGPSSRGWWAAVAWLCLGVVWRGCRARRLTARCS